MTKITINKTENYPNMDTIYEMKRISNYQFKSEHFGFIDEEALVFCFFKIDNKTYSIKENENGFFLFILVGSDEDNPFINKTFSLHFDFTNMFFELKETNF